MSALAFLHLDDDRLTIRMDQIVAVRELGESDLDIRTGNLRLGIPSGAVTVISTATAGKHYVSTPLDEIDLALREWTGTVR